jgi:hypothetical protein
VSWTTWPSGKRNAVRPDDQELAIAYDPVLAKPDLAGQVQPHPFDRRDGQLGNHDRHCLPPAADLQLCYVLPS